MKIKSSIMYKMFAFTFALITAILLVSFAALYFIMPRYYVYMKEKEFNKNYKQLVETVNQSAIEEIPRIVFNFSNENNATVIIIDLNNEIVKELSSPFLRFIESAEFMIQYVPESEDNINQISIVKNNENNEIIEEVNPQLSIAIAEKQPQEGFSASATEYAQEKIYSLDEAESLKIYVREDNYDSTEHIYTPSNDNGINGFWGIANPVASQYQSVISYSTDIKNNDILKTINATITLQPVGEAQKVILSLIPYLLVFDILITLISTYFYSRRFTGPILKISETAVEMGNLSKQSLSNIRTNDELGMLSENLDHMYLNLCHTIDNLENEINKVIRLEESKADFMRAASHELKTPISVLNGLIEGMSDNVGKYADRDKYLEISKKKAEELSVLVDYILNVSALNDVKDTLSYEEINVKEILEGLIKNYEISVKEKNLKLETELSDCIYITDERNLSLVFSNLIKNAVTYTKPSGKITVKLTASQKGGICSIENECTLPEDINIADLFEPFFTASYSRSKNESGTGLGLYIVKKTLETLGFLYEAERTDTGFKFTVIF